MHLYGGLKLAQRIRVANGLHSKPLNTEHPSLCPSHSPVSIHGLTRATRDDEMV